MAEHGAQGPALQVALFRRGEQPPADEVDAFAARARAVFGHVLRQPRASR